MDWSTVISTLVGVVLGGLVTAYFSWQGSKQLRREADEIRTLNLMLIDFLDDAGVIEVERDAKGDPVRVRVIRREVTDSVDTSDSVQVTLIRGEVQDENPTDS